MFSVCLKQQELAATSSFLFLGCFFAFILVLP